MLIPPLGFIQMLTVLGFFVKIFVFTDKKFACRTNLKTQEIKCQLPVK